MKKMYYNYVIYTFCPYKKKDNIDIGSTNCFKCEYCYDDCYDDGKVSSFIFEDKLKIVKEILK